MIEKLNQIETKAGEIKELYKRLQALVENRKESIKKIGDLKEILKLLAESIMLEIAIDCIKCYVDIGEDIEAFNFAEELPGGENIFDLLQYWDNYSYDSFTRNLIQHLNKDSVLQLVYSDTLKSP